MTNKVFPGDIVDINLPFNSSDEEASDNDELPPPYEYPKIDFSDGWKDRGFGIGFGIFTVAVISVGLLLYIPTIYSITKLVENNEHFNEYYQHLFDSCTKVEMYAFVGAAAAGSVIQFFIFFLLQLCAGRIIMCACIISIILEVVLGVALLVTVHWGACIGLFCLSIVTVISSYCLRTSIPFIEVHLRIVCVILCSYPSLILVAAAVAIAEVLWFILWLFLTVGILFVLIPLDQSDTKQGGSPSHSYFICSIIGFFIIIAWYWGAATLANMTRFISACTVVKWWFGNSAEQQYTFGTNMKRTFTTSFGTICLGSLLGPVLEAIHSTAEERNGTINLASIAACTFRAFKNIVNCMTCWALIYAALTGQSFVQAGRSFNKLYKRHELTILTNDLLAGYCSLVVNLIVAFTSAVTGGLIAYAFVKNMSSEKITWTIIIAVVISSLIGLLYSVVMTILVSSCLRTIFVCFALDPAALGTTHPEHLRHLNEVCHKVYPAEIAAND
jgi:hypothetical protein